MTTTIPTPTTRPQLRVFSGPSGDHSPRPPADRGTNRPTAAAAGCRLHCGAFYHLRPLRRSPCKQGDKIRERERERPLVHVALHSLFACLLNSVGSVGWSGSVDRSVCLNFRPPPPPPVLGGSEPFGVWTVRPLHRCRMGDGKPQFLI
jgi:hypothetical protein